MKNLPVLFLRGVSFQGKAPNILENSHGNPKIEILDHDFPFQLTFSNREFSGVFAGSKSDMADPTVSLPTHLEGGQGRFFFLVNVRIIKIQVNEYSSETTSKHLTIFGPQTIPKTPQARRYLEVYGLFLFHYKGFDTQNRRRTGRL